MLPVIMTILGCWIIVICNKFMENEDIPKKTQWIVRIIIGVITVVLAVVTGFIQFSR